MKRKIILLLILVGIILTFAPVSVFADECVWVKLRNGDIVRLDRSKTFASSGQTFYKGCGFTFDSYPANDVSFYGSAKVGQATDDIHCVGIEIPAGSKFVITRQIVGTIYVWWQGSERTCPTHDFMVVGSVFLDQIWDFDGSSIVNSEQPAATATSRPPTATPIPPSPTPVPSIKTPVPTATKKPLATVVSVATIGSSNPTSPQPKSKSVADKIMGAFGKVCIGFLLVLGTVVLVGGVGKWQWKQWVERRREEEARKKKTNEEWREEFLRCLRQAQSALRKSPPDIDTATKAFFEADKLRAFAQPKERVELDKVRRNLFELGVREI